MIDLRHEATELRIRAAKASEDARSLLSEGMIVMAKQRLKLAQQLALTANALDPNGVPELRK